MLQWVSGDSDAAFRCVFSSFILHRVWQRAGARPVPGAVPPRAAGWCSWTRRRRAAAGGERPNPAQRRAAQPGGGGGERRQRAAGSCCPCSELRVSRRRARAAPLRAPSALGERQRGRKAQKTPARPAALQPGAGSRRFTTSLIIALVFVSLLFLVSAAAFVACKACKRKELSSGPVLYGPSSVQSYLADGAAAGTLPHAYCYEVSLTTGSGNSEFKFLKPVLPSLPAQHSSTGVAGNHADDFPPAPMLMGDADFESPGIQSVGQFNGL